MALVMPLKCNVGDFFFTTQSLVGPCYQHLKLLLTDMNATCGVHSTDSLRKNHSQAYNVQRHTDVYKRNDIIIELLMLHYLEYE